MSKKKLNQLESKVAKRCAVLVVSCDNYSDVWDSFFELFHRYWSDCPFNIYLLSNTINSSFPNVRNILTGKDISWSDNLKKALDDIEENYVLLIIEDLYLYNIVQTDRVLRVIDWAICSDANYVRMNPLTMADKAFNDLVGIVSEGTIYRTSTVMSLWNKEVLHELLKPGESAWDFEVYGSIRSDKYDRFYATWQNYFPILNTIIKSKWNRFALYKLRKIGVYPDLSRRRVMTVEESAAFLLKRFRTMILKVVPSRFRRGLKKWAQFDNSGLRN
jgi:hypothetical protein